MGTNFFEKTYRGSGDDGDEDHEGELQKQLGKFSFRVISKFQT